jgi:hypothetical protein
MKLYRRLKAKERVYTGAVEASRYFNKLDGNFLPVSISLLLIVLII